MLRISSWIGLGFILLARCSLAQAEETVRRYYLEAEHCDGLVRSPYDVENAPGWYAREACSRACGAPGRSYCAAIHDTASDLTMTQALTTPIPPGKYRGSLRVLGPKGTADKDTIVRVELGKSSVTFRWRVTRSNNAVWQSGGEIAITEPVEQVSFTAVQFGGRAVKAYYEAVHRTIWADTLYLTSDLTEKAPPDLLTERALRAGVDPTGLKERPVYKSDEHYSTPQPETEAIAKSIPLAAFDGRKNLWPNSSFELGMNDGWASGTDHVFARDSLEDKGAFHGRYCLRIPGGSNQCFGRPYWVAEELEATFSVYVRGNGSPVNVRLRHVTEKDAKGPHPHGQYVRVGTSLELKGEATAEWQRLVGTAKLARGWHYLSVRGPEPFWIDAAQLERGAAASAYAPRAELEAGLSTGELANILYEPTRDLYPWFHNSGNAKRAASIEYRVVDVWERVVAEGTTAPVEVKPGETVRGKVRILPSLRGMFSVTYAVAGRALPEGELACLRMPPPPDKPTRHELGANLSLNPHVLAVHNRLGLKWALTCKTRHLGSPRDGVRPVQGRPDLWKWHDETLAPLKKLKMNVIPALLAGHTSSFGWMRRPVDPWRYRTTRGGVRPYVPKLDVWRDYVWRVVDHYKDEIQYWEVEDEAELAWEPALFAPILNATLEGVAKVKGKKINVGYSGVPAYQEEVFRYIDPDRIDFLGSSSFHDEYWQSRYVKRMQDQYRKRWVCTGVGGRPPMKTMYHTLYTFEPPRWKVAWMARRMATNLLVQDNWIPGHYAAILVNRGDHLPDNKPLCDYDGTPLPWGGTYGCMGTLLAEAVPVADVPLGKDRDRRAVVFTIGDKLYAVTWSTFLRSYVYHWKPGRRKLDGVRLSCPQGSVEVLDLYFNRMAGPRWQNGALVLDLDEEPVFIANRDLSRDEFIEMLRAAVIPPQPIEVSFGFVPDASGVALGVTARNRTGATVKGVTIDFRPTPRKHYMDVTGEWLLAEPVQTIGDLGAGEEKVVMLSTVLDDRELPYENGYLQSVVTTGDGREFTDHNWLWLHAARPVEAAPTIDGKLEEWEKRSAAWLFYDYGWGVNRHLMQLDDGGENFGYPPYTIDGRAAFWASYDKTNLYLAVRLQDDQAVLDPRNGEKVRILIRSEAGGVSQVEVLPDAEGSGTARLSNADRGSSDLTVKSTVSVDGTSTIGIELAIPWDGLGVEPKSGSILGFDLVYTDVDRANGKLVAGSMRWAGGAREMGYMWLR